MTIALLAFTDGRDDLLGQTLAALEANIDPTLIGERFLNDDTGDGEHATKLAALYPHWTVLATKDRQGFGRAIQGAWALVAAASTAKWICHWEDDMIPNRPVDLAGMVGLLETQPHLAQVVLRRQAWNAAERAAGGIIEQHPTDYTDCSDGAGRRWVEHTRFWSTNPSVYSRALCHIGWPARDQSEGHFGIGLRQLGLPWGIPGEDVRFAFWGARDDPPAVEHIGHTRAGYGY